MCSDGVPTAGPSVGGAITSLGNDNLGLIDVILLLIGLCFHAFFEGLAVGLAPDVAEVWNLTISICLNEVCFKALDVLLLEWPFSDTQMWFLVLLCTFRNNVKWTHSRSVAPGCILPSLSVAGVLFSFCTGFWLAFLVICSLCA